MGLIYQVPFTVPATPPVELAHAANFEEFDGLTTPTTNNTNASRFGTTYGCLLYTSDAADDYSV